MLTGKTPICLIASADTKKSRPFYEETLGLKCISDNAHGLVFDLGVTVLRIQADPNFRAQTNSVHGWRVDDIESEIRELGVKGVEFVRFPCFEQDELGIWETKGARIAWFLDPDRNVLSLTEVNRT